MFPIKIRKSSFKNKFVKDDLILFLNSISLFINSSITNSLFDFVETPEPILYFLSSSIKDEVSEFTINLSK
ncbi:hypothetical protein [Mycoplasma capricolum]|uniref:hypothetical protein n=1 Tax=Mycoplasma capricolum TaxID=2095 RepID=UPI0008653786|nr:hypothetical protein [Mycoplasma capricolum]AOQ22033.1 hypothetical protein M1601_01610 [Mycoplasma capricolum subsp. capripneumoniae M1601]